MKFFVSFLIFGFLFSVSVQALAVCPNYQVVSSLTIEKQKQKDADWCTFAAVRVVTSHYGLTKSQCQLVEDAVNRPCCNVTTFDLACHPDPPLWPHDVFNSSTVNFSYTPYTAHPLSWVEIVDEICGHNRPLLAVATPTWLYEEGHPNWHAVVIEGYRIESTGEQKVSVFDPQDDLCEPSSCTDQNPRFVNYDYFFLNEVTHTRDYIDIGSNLPDIPRTNSDNTAPARPQGLNLF